MKRRNCLLVLALAAGCRSSEERFSLPATAGGRALTSSRELPEAESPDEARALGVTQIVRGEYSGTPAMRVTVYVMKNDTGAFELMQKWRRAESTLPFHKGRLLVVVESPEADRAALDAFSRAFEQALTIQ